MFVLYSVAGVPIDSKRIDANANNAQRCVKRCFDANRTVHSESINAFRRLVRRKKSRKSRKANGEKPALYLH